MSVSPGRCGVVGCRLDYACAHIIILAEISSVNLLPIRADFVTERDIQQLARRLCMRDGRKLFQHFARLVKVIILGRMSPNNVDKLLFWTFLWAPKPLVLNRKHKVLSNHGRGGIVQTLIILVIHKLRPQESYSSATEVKLL